jgi:outer membrane protein assembly factor BamD (BamD/ComL family)
MRIGESMNDGLFVAQMNFIIGRVYNTKQEYEISVYFHEKHLNLAEQFQDSKGQCRAYFILSQLYEKINQNDKAKKYLSLYKTLAREVGERKKKIF